MEKNSNHARAPESAAFVEQLREVFGDVQVLHVRENDLTIGNPVRYVNARIFDMDALIKSAGRKHGKKTRSD